ncbi:MAG: hypothetical protein KME43_14965 [Myxacorys chilensis ATA2-1-KO14]|jgi:hypothetical protein|nr:hypothetical protein [Myxacorys chilensis ATA2-1-KO14]
MKFRLVSVLVGAAPLSIFSGAIVDYAPSISQNISASTHRPGFWQPKARINPTDPIQIVILNQTDFPLDFGLTTNQPQVI